MRQIYAFKTKEEYGKYQDVIDKFTAKLENYRHVLEDKYKLTTLPKGVVWTSEDLATTVFSDLPVPAYTDRGVIYISPDLSSWRDLLIKQLDEKNIPEIERFYKDCSDDYLFTILAQELTRYSNLFIEKEQYSWFKEGMCHYLSRKLLLDESEFREITKIELLLVEVYKGQYGGHSLEEFGKKWGEENSLVNRIFDYWRSYLAIEFLVEVRAKNDIDWVLNEYTKWDQLGRSISLTEHFGMGNFFN